MAIEVGSILQWKFKQELSSQEVLNVQYYRVIGQGAAVTSLAGFAEPLFDLWADNLSSFQSSALFYRLGELYEVNGLAYDAYAPDPVRTGGIAGEHLPVFVSASVQQIRASRVTRHGWKRFAGIVETSGWTTTNSLTPTAITAIQTAADNLFNGVIEVVDPLNPETRYLQLQAIIWGGNSIAYPMGRFSDIQALSVKPYLTTQNTRKIGRGS